MKGFCSGASRVAIRLDVMPTTTRISSRYIVKDIDFSTKGLWMRGREKLLKDRLYHNTRDFMRFAVEN